MPRGAWAWPCWCHSGHVMNACQSPPKHIMGHSWDRRMCTGEIWQKWSVATRVNFWICLGEQCLGEQAMNVWIGKRRSQSSKCCISCVCKRYGTFQTCPFLKKNTISNPGGVGAGPLKQWVGGLKLSLFSNLFGMMLKFVDNIFHQLAMTVPMIEPWSDNNRSPRPRSCRASRCFLMWPKQCSRSFPNFEP